MEPNETTTLVEQLALLNDVEGVSNAIDSKYDGPVLNNMTVTYYVAQSGGSKAKRRIPCLAASGQTSSLAPSRPSGACALSSVIPSSTPPSSE